jgi:glutaredoxin
MAKTFARVRGKTSSSGTLYTIIIISTVFLLAVILSNKDVIRERFFGGSDAKRLSFEYYYMDTCGHCVEFNETGIWDKLNKETFNHISLKKYNRSEHLERVKSLGISSFPTFVVVDNSSNIIASFEEARTYEKLLAFIRKYDKE